MSNNPISSDIQYITDNIREETYYDFARNSLLSFLFFLFAYLIAYLLLKKLKLFLKKQWNAKRQIEEGMVYNIFCFCVVF